MTWCPFYCLCSFHPELTDDLRLTQYFIDMVEILKNRNK
ncbi:hypothetical protein I5776_00085 [Heyndrickxia vini]|uniref:Uncharacterized protein n=1 Tax=Heyndrickxia vini TaxID=1476025 RepID=A0ABX7E2C6_9BACI|nr:hypothetical protein I5776_00085 [Heyndrickxia vini]